MIKWFKRLGNALFLPLAVLPLFAILGGIGYAFVPAASEAGTGFIPNEIFYSVGVCLIRIGNACMDHIPVLFAVGISVGMSKDGGGAAGFAGLVSYLVLTGFPGSDMAAVLTGEAEPAFETIGNLFTGILSGLIGAGAYNRLKGTGLPEPLSFFSEKRAAVVFAAFASVLVSGILFFIWPLAFHGLSALGEALSGMGAVGAGLRGFLGRLFLPLGLHYAFGPEFFPFLLMGLPAAFLAIYHTACREKKQEVFGIFLTAAACILFAGLTEPLEILLLFLAPGLYLLHAVFTGLLAGILAVLPIQAGISDSGGIIGFAFRFFTQDAEEFLYLIPLLFLAAVFYYLVFRLAIIHLGFQTPGWEEETPPEETKAALESGDVAGAAQVILDGVGGRENVRRLDSCVTRLRFEIRDHTLINEKKIRSAGIAGIIRPGKYSIQAVIGMKARLVAEEMRKML